MHATWPFFRTLLSNMDMVMAKADLAIASRYADLVSDATLRDEIFGRIRAEWELTRRHCWPSSNRTTCSPTTRCSSARSAPASPTWTRSTTCRSSCCKRHRAGEGDERVQRGIHMSINGIAAGLRNSGGAG
jgi:phosphoenolpyruvate carboxylase